ncbi:unnamed protein product [Caenorhabditis brenneri]
MQFLSFLLLAILALGAFSMDTNSHHRVNLHPRYLRQLPYGSYGNVQYGGSGPSAGNGWNGGLVGSARGFGFGTGSDGYH